MQNNNYCLEKNYNYMKLLTVLFFLNAIKMDPCEMHGKRTTGYPPLVSVNTRLNLIVCLSVYTLLP